MPTGVYIDVNDLGVIRIDAVEQSLSDVKQFFAYEKPVIQGNADDADRSLHRRKRLRRYPY